MMLLLLGIVFLVLFGILFSFKENDHQLVELLHTPGMTVWIYDVRKNTFVWLDENGKPSRMMTFNELKEQQGEANYEKLYGILHRLVEGKSQKEATDISLESGNNLPGRYLIVNISVLRTRQGIPEQIIGIARDISKNKDIGTYIRNIDYVLKTGGAQIVRYDIQRHQLNIYSKMGQVRLSLPRDYCLRLVTEECREQVSAFLNQMDAGKDCLYEMSVATKIHTRDGKRVYADFSFNPVYDNKTGKKTEYFGLCRDMTEQKDAEARLQKEQEKAQAAEMAQEAFIRNMNYETRIPMNAIIDNVRMFNKKHLQESEPKYVEAIREYTRQLLTLTDEAIQRTRSNTPATTKPAL